MFYFQEEGKMYVLFNFPSKSLMMVSPDLKFPLRLVGGNMDGHSTILNIKDYYYYYYILSIIQKTLKDTRISGT